MTLDDSIVYRFQEILEREATKAGTINIVVGRVDTCGQQSEQQQSV